MKRNIRNAHTSYCLNGVYQNFDQTHCSRISILRALGYNQPINEQSEMTFALGIASEKLFEKEYPQAERDVSCFLNLPNNNSVLGHADAILNNTVYELKSISSTNTAKLVLIDQQFKQGHMLQLLGYMILLGKPNGVLRYTNYVWHSSTKWKVKPCHVEYKAHIDDDGNITINGIARQFTATDIVNSWLAIDKALKTDILPDQHNTNDNPCFFCPLKTDCEHCTTIPELVKLATSKNFQIELDKQS